MKTIKVLIDEEFKIQPKEKALLDGFEIEYGYVSYPYKREGERQYGDAQISFSEDNDSRSIAFYIDKPYQTRFHDYTIISKPGKTDELYLTISHTPYEAKISETEAVKIAIKAAHTCDFPYPKAQNRYLIKDLKNIFKANWHIEITSSRTTDIYIQFIIDSDSGKIISTKRGSRA